MRKPNISFDTKKQCYICSGGGKYAAGSSIKEAYKCWLKKIMTGD